MLANKLGLYSCDDDLLYDGKRFMTYLPLPIAFLILFFPPSKGVSNIVDLHTFFHTGNTQGTVT